MAPRRYTHPIVRYLRLYDWEWVPTEQIVNAVGCTPNELQTLVTSRGYKHLIEYRNGEYRYIGNYSCERRLCVELLKSVYPASLSGGEIQKRAGLGKNAGWVMAKYLGLLPVEVIIEHQRYKGDVKRYRYIPNDPRSLLDIKPVMSAKQRRINKNKQDALRLLKKYPNEWFSANEIAARLGRESGGSLSQTLLSLPQSEPHVHVKIGRVLYNDKRYYCYAETPMEADA